MYLDICFIYVHSKYYESKKTKTTYILFWNGGSTRQAEKVPELSWFQACGDITRLGRKQNGQNRGESSMETIWKAEGTRGL